jgi:hypothetical protein
MHLAGLGKIEAITQRKKLQALPLYTNLGTKSCPIARSLVKDYIQDATWYSQKL